MELVMPLCAGGLIAAGLYLMLRRNMFSIFVGLVILAHGVNVAVFTAGGLDRGRAPVLEKGEPAATTLADPLPQALILTAIVIGLAVQAFLLVLLYRLFHMARTADLDETRLSEPGEPQGDR